MKKYDIGYFISELWKLESDMTEEKVAYEKALDRLHKNLIELEEIVHEHSLWDYETN